MWDQSLKNKLKVNAKKKPEELASSGFLLYICEKNIMEKELLEAFLLDVKQMVTNNPNDVDLGKTLRIYFNNFSWFIISFF